MRRICTGRLWLAVVGVLVVTLAARPSDEEPRNPTGSDLLVAAREGNIPEVTALLAEGVDPDAPDGRRILRFQGDVPIWSPTPLQEAARRNHATVVRILLRAGADPSQKGISDEPGQELFPWLGEELRGPAWARQMLEHLERRKGRATFTCGHPLGAAAMCGNLAILKILLEEVGVPVDDRELTIRGQEDGWTALIFGTLEKDEAVCAYLLDKGADPNLRYEEGGVTALHYAAARNSPGIVHLLLERGGEPSAADLLGNTPLHFASASESPEACRDLLARGANPCAANEAGFTPLHAAAANGAYQTCQILLDREVDPNAADGEGRTALHLAALRGDGKLCEMLLIGGATPAIRNVYGETPIHLAAASGDINTILLLLQAGCSVRSHSSLGMTPLHYAASFDRRPAAAILIQRGALMNATAAEGFTPLHLAVLQGSNAVFPLLLILGAKPSPPDGEGWTPLHLAAFKAGPFDRYFFGSREDRAAEVDRLVAAQKESMAHDPVFRLLEFDADARAQNLAGETPLHLAAYVNRPDYCDLLLSAGSPVNAETREGLTPLDLAHLSGSEAAEGVLLQAGGQPGPHPSREMLRALLHEACLQGDDAESERLLVAGADPNAADGETPPLCAAAVGNCTRCARLLCLYGADPNAPCHPGHPPLFEAVVRAGGPFLKVLLDAGAKVGAADDEGRTALHLASARGCQDSAPDVEADPSDEPPNSVQALLDRGADPNFMDRWGRTALHEAAERGELETVVPLVNRGADPNATTTAGLSPLDLAPEEEPDDPGVSSFLRSRGARPGKPESVKLFRAVYDEDFAAANSLLLLGADPNVLPSMIGTPLQLAVARGDIPFMELLVSYGARINQDLPWKRTVLQVALESQYDFGESARWLLDHGANGGRWGVMPHSRAQADLLLNYGFPVEDIGLGISWLAGAVTGSDGDYVRYLLRRGADPDFRLQDGSTPLHLSTGGIGRPFDLRTMEDLLRAGADPDLRDQGGRTPGHLAAANAGPGWFNPKAYDGGIPMLELLAAFGADLSLRDYGGKTPRDLAQSRHGLFTAFWLRRWEILKTLGLNIPEPARRGGSPAGGH